MVFLFALLVILTIWGSKYSAFHEDYMGKTASYSIKGIFTVFILYRHVPEYMNLTDTWADRMFVSIDSYMAQLIVAMFFFYSGYGIMTSINNKPNYLEDFFKKRIVKVLCHFDVAVFLFILLQLSLGRIYSRGEYILSWIGWFSVGNSNWFIFDILALYFITWLVFTFSKHMRRIGNNCVVFIHVLLISILWVGLFILKPGMHWWIDTLFTYPLGMTYAIHKPRIDSKLRSSKYYIITASTLGTVFFAWHYYIGVDQYGICACIFCLLISVLSMRFQFNNKIIQWLGIYSFSIYIMQRWPMLFFVHQGWNSSNLLFVCISIPSALAVAWVFQKILNQIDCRYFS